MAVMASGSRLLTPENSHLQPIKSYLQPIKAGVILVLEKRENDCP